MNSTLEFQMNMVLKIINNDDYGLPTEAKKEYQD